MGREHSLSVSICFLAFESCEGIITFQNIKNTVQQNKDTSEKNSIIQLLDCNGYFPREDPLPTQGSYPVGASPWEGALLPSWSGLWFLMSRQLGLGQQAAPALSDFERGQND